MLAHLKIGGVLDFTAEFGLKVSQVTAGFGYGEGYYAKKPHNLKSFELTNFDKSTVIYFTLR